MFYSTSEKQHEALALGGPEVTHPKLSTTARGIDVSICFCPGQEYIIDAYLSLPPFSSLSQQTARKRILHRFGVLLSFLFLRSLSDLAEGDS
ncbi:hypothetical protein RJT34_32252 [Clitoria ternatea]|uniref:Uncharacterized protein n=1 Tax=Clitoria ternatea TaxID=43366 RepID=A0AAN9EXD0_CLITE